MTPANAAVEKNQNESNQNLIRRFSKRVQSARIIPRVRKGQFYQRDLSPNVKKEQTLKQLRRAQRRERLKKLGKIPS